MIHLSVNICCHGNKVRTVLQIKFYLLTTIDELTVRSHALLGKRRYSNLVS